MNLEEDCNLFKFIEPKGSTSKPGDGVSES